MNIVETHKKAIPRGMAFFMRFQRVPVFPKVDAR